MTRTHKLALLAVVALAVGGGGAAVAGSQLGSQGTERDTVIEDAARELGVEPQALRDALGKALQNRVDAAVERGRLTEKQAERLKKGIAEGRLPMLHGARKGLGMHGRSGKLDAASEYLELSPEQLRDELRNGKTLAEIAGDRGKSVDGLVDALMRPIEERLDQAVEDDRLTEERKDAMLERLKGRVEAMVNGEHRRPFFGHRFRGGGGGPPAWAPRD